MKTALLVVSFGTTHPDTLEDTIAATENTLAAAFPQYPMYRAFTSATVRRRLKSKYGLHADSVEEALARIGAEGFGRVLIQPTLVIPGEEYDRLLSCVQASAGSLSTRVGRPLLCGDGDLDAIIGILRDAFPVDDGPVLLFMGHGTKHSASGIYTRLARKIEALSGGAMTACTMNAFDAALETLSAGSRIKVRLVPLLFTAGTHAKEDMAGRLRTTLEAEGFTVEPIFQGLGQLEAVREIYVRRVAEIL